MFRISNSSDPYVAFAKTSIRSVFVQMNTDIVYCSSEFRIFNAGNIPVYGHWRERDGEPQGAPRIPARRERRCRRKGGNLLLSANQNVLEIISVINLSVGYFTKTTHRISLTNQTYLSFLADQSLSTITRVSDPDMHWIQIWIPIGSVFAALLDSDPNFDLRSRSKSACTN